MKQKLKKKPPKFGSHLSKKAKIIIYRHWDVQQFTNQCILRMWEKQPLQATWTITVSQNTCLQRICKTKNDTITLN